ncbi:MAG: 2-oxo acid dehydrogenase subunit E2 [Chloroflexi bacterium]|nr:2-oxo acid dehydrogenase subunit E2 [Chloroflexota bacterium]
MAEVTMPRLSDTMEEGTIAAWLKQPGEQVNKGDVIAQIETDKATMDLTAFEAGTLQEILAPEGSTVAIGKPVARIGTGKAAAAGEAQPAQSSADQSTSGSSVEETSSSVEDTSGQDISRENTPAADGVDSETQSSTEQPSSTTAVEEPSADQPSSITSVEESSTDQPSSGEQASSRQDIGPANGKVRASPMARHLAAEHGLDLSGISGSGPQGRVVRADVEAAVNGPAAPQSAQPPANGQSPEGQPTETPEQPAPESSGAREQPASPPAATDDERIPLSQMRRTIARRLADSKRTVPHFYLTTTVDATDLGALRTQINQQADNIKISFNDLIVKGAALAIRQVPEVNVSFAEDALIRHRHVHVGIAVATERGLIVPVIRDADQKSVGQIAREAHDLAERANAGKLQPNEYSGGTFSVSNLGMFGVDQFEAVINPPEAAILAVGAIVREPAAHDGQIALRDRVRLTLSVDHRALDGAIGARYLQALRALLEKPMLLLV